MDERVRNVESLVRRALTCFAVAAAVGGVVAGGASAATGYADVVRADNPSAYWRLGEPDGATTAEDASGNGAALTYHDAALLDLEAGIQGDEDTSVAGEGSSVATGHVLQVAPPATFEAWLRANPTGKAQTVFHFAGGGERMVTIGSDGILRAQASADYGHPALHVTGPATPVTDGFWHYVVVDFEAGVIYLDLAAGPPASDAATDSGGSDLMSSLGLFALDPALVDLGGSYDGQLDEVALYPESLTFGQMSAHASAGGLGWDSVEAQGGEESAPPGCFERGLFWKGVRLAGNPDANYGADGAASLITTHRQPNRCGTAIPAGVPNKRATFITGQTIRVKLNGDARNYYVEFGPIQYLCENAGSTCYGLFFNFKAQTTAGGDTIGQDGLNFVYWKPFAGNAIPQIASCNPVGTHAWRLRHADSTWIAEFACDPKHPIWVEFYRYDNGDYGWTAGWPDVEGFDQGYKCGARTPVASCWRREGWMNETHLEFQWLGGDTWNPVAAAVCRVDTSNRWDGRQLPGRPPISVDIFEQHRDTGC